MTITIENLDGVEAWTASAGQPIPVGEHVAEIEDVEEGTTSNTSPQLIISWRVVDGPYRDATSREWLVILPQTYGKVRALLEAVNWPIAPGAFTMPTTQLKGRRAQIVVREDTFEGKTRVKVVGHSRVPALAGGEVPIDTAGLPAPSPPPADDLPF